MEATVSRAITRVQDVPIFLAISSVRPKNPSHERFDDEDEDDDDDDVT